MSETTVSMSEETHKPITPIWSSTVIAVFCLFFTFLVAGLMNALSYKRVGKDAEAKKRMAFVIGGFIVFGIVIFAFPALPQALFTGIHVATIIYFSQDQKKLIQKYGLEDHKAKVLKPLLIGIGFTIIWGAVLIGSTLNSDASNISDYATEKIDKVIEQENKLVAKEKKLAEMQSAEKAHQYLKETMIPAAKKVKEVAESIEVSGEKLKDIHQLMIEKEALLVKAYQVQAKLTKLAIPPISSEDQQELNQLVEKNKNVLQKIKKKRDTYQKKLLALAEENGVKLEQKNVE